MLKGEQHCDALKMGWHNRLFESLVYLYFSWRFFYGRILASKKKCFIWHSLNRICHDLLGMALSKTVLKGGVINQINIYNTISLRWNTDVIKKR